MKLKYFLLLLLVALSSNAEEATPATAKSIKVINPINNTLYSGEDSTFVVECNSTSVDKLEIIKNSVNIATLDVNNSKDTYCKSIKLDVGENAIVVNSYKDNTLVDSVEHKYYYFVDVFEKSNEYDAEDYDKNYFHAPENEDKCKKCHDMSSNVPTNGEPFEDVTQTTCYSCHTAKVSKKNTHAPTANWLCLDCHNGKIGEYNMDKEGTAKYMVPDPVAKTCGECHDTVEGWFMNKYTHGPTNDGRCIRCHNPHGSDNEFFLRKTIWNLCTTCHNEKATGKHIVASFVFGRNGGAHPTKAPVDFARPERKFVCSSCHNPHGSSGIYLLRMRGSQPFGVCQRCHKKA